MGVEMGGGGDGGGTIILLLTLTSLTNHLVHAYTPTLNPAHSTPPSCHPSATQALGGLIRQEDYEYDVKFLPFNQQVSTYLQEGEAKRCVWGVGGWMGKWLNGWMTDMKNGWMDGCITGWMNG